MTQRQRVARLCFSINVNRATGNQRQRARSYRQLSRLWDLIDHMEEPEPLWQEMLATSFWAFRDKQDPNSIIRTYHDAIIHATYAAKLGYDRMAVCR